MALAVTFVPWSWALVHRGSVRPHYALWLTPQSLLSGAEMPESQGPTPSPLAASPRGGSPVASSQGLDRAPLDGLLVPQLSRARFWALQLQGEGQCLSQPLPATPSISYGKGPLTRL